MTSGVAKAIAQLHEAGDGLTDGQLLARFVAVRDEASFAALLRRHGPMVLGVCRRVLRNAQDAEDAFQASFLVLARKAAAVLRRESVGCWLYAVAYRTALQAARVNARRRIRERQVQDMPHPEAAPVEQLEETTDWRPLLDRELNRLSEKCRAAVVLCDLEGQSQRQAARRLGVSLSTLSSRLTRGRQLLARRLTARGIVLSGGVLAALLAAESASAQVPTALVHTTARVAALAATGPAALAGAVSAPVAALTEGVLKAMFVNKLKNVVLVVVALGVAGGIAGLAPLWGLFDQAGYAQTAAATRTAEDGKATRTVTVGDKDKKVVGSGKTETKKFDVADFTALDANSALEIEITQAKAFSVTATADDNLLALIKVEKKDAALHLGFAENTSVETKNPMRVTITMPTLKGVVLNGACSATLKGFESNDDFHAKIDGATALTGTLKAKTLKVEADGASRVKIQGSAKDATLMGTGASDFALKDFALDNAAVKLDGACSAVVNAKTKLDYEVTGASSLKYLGAPTIGKKEMSGASSVKQVKDEK